MSHRNAAERSASNESSAPDFYLPGTPTNSGITGRLLNSLPTLFGRRGKVRGDRRREQ
ncbi:hypothetical protein [Natrarchaeobius chitinivorans]|uniref:hypothetical protein n=1 Tax=Natrarchaeobius chitinivorans TaxID=1679083 RepID=UPI001404D283|nr:hypothetical protein [Natrarchaeobius chitinivorans]